MNIICECVIYFHESFFYYLQIVLRQMKIKSKTRKLESSFPLFAQLFFQDFFCPSSKPKYSCQGIYSHWFWNPVRASGLHELLYTWYKNETHANITTLCERWHPETRSFYLPVGEMTITLDDVANLLHVPFSGAWSELDGEVVGRLLQ